MKKLKAIILGVLYGGFFFFATSTYLFYFSGVPDYCISIQNTDGSAGHCIPPLSMLSDSWHNIVVLILLVASGVIAFKSYKYFSEERLF